MGLRDRHLYHDRNIFFITTTCNGWMHLLSIGNSMQIISESLNFCTNKYNSAILGYVIMPNHIHLLIHFHEGAKRIDYMRDFKKFTSTKIRQEIEKYEPQKLEKLVYAKDNQVFKVWKERYDEVYIESIDLFKQKLHYIHMNPLQSHWNLVKRPEDYIYSSAKFYELEIEGNVYLKHYLDYFG